MTDLDSRMKEIKLVIFDVDGVLTDNTVFIGPDGAEFKRFSIADGLGMHIARKHGIQIAFLSGRPSPATAIRARELGIADIVQEPVDKLTYYNRLKAKYELADDQIAFMGNDLVDLGVMHKCGLAAAVPDSPPEVLESAAYVSKKHGGFGAAREFLDVILEAKGINEKLA